MRAGVIGAGSWGSAFALHLGRLHVPTRLWVREKEILEELKTARQNSVFLPGHIFPPSVSFSSEAREVVESAEVVFTAVPSRYCRPVYQQVAPVLAPVQTVVSLTKGIEEGSLKRMTEVMQEVFASRPLPRLAVLSGPSFAREVAERHPTAVVVASADLECAKTVQHLVSNFYFRAYAGRDVIGVEMAGALKNVIALAAGISDGLRFGHNPRAALITRGLAEISRLGVKMGARPETFFGLAGIGDLVLTCTARQSRNYRVGYELGKGGGLAEILARTKMVAEGVSTTLSVHHLARKAGIEMPISAEVFKILYENKNPRECLRDLMLRALREET
ncbi:MAG: NAD(P)H-dependent glycerol-3-phosphate dehydrogenase [Acidobacteriota bacterium]